MSETIETCILHHSSCGYYIKKHSRHGLLYLNENGCWYGNMISPPTYESGGTYFPTLQEVIDVLCEFNIHVIGPDDEE